MRRGHTSYTRSVAREEWRSCEEQREEEDEEEGHARVGTIAPCLQLLNSCSRNSCGRRAFGGARAGRIEERERE